MSEPFIYESEHNHVEKRSELSDQLQQQLTELQTVSGKRDQWPQHHRFAGEAEFWTQVHRALLGATAELPQRCASLMLTVDDPAVRKNHSPDCRNWVASLFTMRTHIIMLRITIFSLYFNVHSLH